MEARYAAEAFLAASPIKIFIRGGMKNDQVDPFKYIQDSMYHQVTTLQYNFL